MESLTSLLTNHHERCDAAFCAAENAAQAGQWPACRAEAERFSRLVLAHFDMEERILFPALESHMGEGWGPTTVMRREHAQMRDLLAELSQAAADADADGFEGVAGTLLILMEQHNLKEETILYPAGDRVVAEPEALLDIIRAALEEDLHV